MTGPIHLVLAVPGWKLSPLHASSREQLMMECLRRGVELSIMPEFASGIDLARNITVAKFREIPGEPARKRLMMVDSDLAFDPESIFAMLDANLDVVGALYPKKVVDYAAVANASRHGVPDAELRLHAGQFVGGAEAGSRRSHVSRDGKHRFVEADKLGTGFLMMKAEAIEKFIAFHRTRIEHHSHWEPKGEQHLVFFSEPQGRRQRTRDALADIALRYDRRTASADELAKAAYAYADAVKSGELDVYQTEDFSFTTRAKQAGIGCWMYLDSKLAHQGTWVFEGSIAEVLAAAEKAKEESA